MNIQTLHFENKAFAGTRGVSQNNCESGFKRAFLDKKTGRIEIARMQNGLEASMHLIAGLPAEWAASFTKDGSVETLQTGIIAGFVLDGIFFTREEAAELSVTENP